MVSALPSDLQVRLTDIDHPFVKATPCLQWTAVAGPQANDPPIARSISQDDLDLMCMVGGFTSQWFLMHKNALLLSHAPDHANNMFDAWVGPGGLSIDRVYHTLPSLFDAIHAAKMASRDDQRLSLVEEAFFLDEDRPASEAGAAAARDWMYALSGEMIVGSDKGDTRAAAVLKRGIQPRRKSTNRYLAGDMYCRVLDSLFKTSTAKPCMVTGALNDRSTPTEEIAEYIADKWRKLYATGFSFTLSGNMFQRNRELSMSVSLSVGWIKCKERSDVQADAPSSAECKSPG